MVKPDIEVKILQTKNKQDVFMQVLQHDYFSTLIVYNHGRSFRRVTRGVPTTFLPGSYR